MSGETEQSQTQSRPCYTAFQNCINEIREVPTKNLRPLNIDITAAVTRVFGVLSNVRPLNEELARRLPEFDPTLMDRLEDYAHALLYAQLCCGGRRELSEHMQPLLVEAAELRALLLSDAAALAKRKLLDERVVKRFAGVRSYSQMAGDLGALSVLFRNGWDRIQNKTAVTLTELDRAEVLLEELVGGLDARIHTTADRRERLLTRAQVFTLFFDGYDQLRGAIAYIRWKNAEYEKLAPSLYANRKKRRRAGKTKPIAKPESSVEVNSESPPQLATMATPPALSVSYAYSPAGWSGVRMLPPGPSANAW